MLQWCVWLNGGGSLLLDARGGAEFHRGEDGFLKSAIKPLAHGVLIIAPSKSSIPPRTQ